MTSSLCAVLTGLLAFELNAAISLPASGYLAGPLDDLQSSLGDDINNYPFGHGFGAGPIHGWILVQFDTPSGQAAHFRLKWQTVGDSPLIAFANGAYFTGRAVANFESAIQLSQGDLDLSTGKVTNLEVHAVFQNALIHKTARNNRFPLSSSGDRFTVLFGDYPPLQFPFPLPYSERPQTALSLEFTTDSSQKITGINLKGTTFIPITVVPKLALMPTYSFAPHGNTIIPGADGCSTGNQCLADAQVPDGIVSPYNAYLSPTLVMISSELREIVPQPPAPAVAPQGPLIGAAAVGLLDRLYLFGGFDGHMVLNRASFYTPRTNTWTSLPNLPSAVWEGCAAAMSGKVYVAGGKQNPTGAPSSAVSVLDAASGTWSSAAHLPVAISNGACASIGGRLYVFGGQTLAGVTAASWVLNPATGQWAAIAPIPAPLAGSAVAVAGTDIYLANGSSDGQSASRRVFLYSSASGTWREGPPTARPVYQASAAYLNGRLFVAGGRSSVGGPVDVGTVLFDSQSMQMLAQGKWFAGLYPPLPAAEMAGAVIGDTWYLAGGDTSLRSSPAATDVLQAYNNYQGWAISADHPVFTGDTVRNSASLGVGAAQLSPGALASILGQHLAAFTYQAPPIRFDGRYFTTDLPENLAGIHITVDGVPAGVMRVSPSRIDFQVPFSVQATSTPRMAPIQVTVDGAAVQAPEVLTPIIDSAPGIFIYTHDETRAINYLDQSAAVAFNEDGTLNYPSHPATRQTLITIRATGLGDVGPRPEPLQRAPRQPASIPVKLPTVMIDGKAAPIASSRLVPGEAGVYEIQVRVPQDARSGMRVPVVLVSGEIQSNIAVLAIQ